MKLPFAIIEVDLVYPFKTSLETLHVFLQIWGGKHISCGTLRQCATFGLESYKFEMIWLEPPRIGRWRVPEGMEDFISEVRVINVKEFPVK